MVLALHSHKDHGFRGAVSGCVKGMNVPDYGLGLPCPKSSVCTCKEIVVELLNLAAESHSLAARFPSDLNSPVCGLW